MADEQDDQPRDLPEIIYDGPVTPPCIDCQGPTIKTGTCYSCLNCGSTSGCG